MSEWICQHCCRENNGGRLYCWKCERPRPQERIVVMQPCTGCGGFVGVPATERAGCQCEPPPDLPARYHAALDEVEAKTKDTARAILALFHELEQATGAEVKDIKLARHWPEHKPSFVQYVTLELEALPQGRRVHPAGR